MPSVAVELSVKPSRAAGNVELDIRGVVRNLGAENFDVQSSMSDLLVDGKPSESWAWAIGNGTRDRRESALPTGEQVELYRRLPASSVLLQSGRHELILEVRGYRSPPVTVERE